MVIMFKEIMDYMCENITVVSVIILLIIVMLITWLKKTNAEIFYGVKYSVLDYISKIYPVLIGVSVGIITIIIIYSFK